MKAPSYKQFEDGMERLILAFTSPGFAEDVRLARAEFFGEAGILDEADQGLDLRMTQFLDWYLLSGPVCARAQRFRNCAR
jgi:hypothetical protein